MGWWEKAFGSHRGVSDQAGLVQGQCPFRFAASLGCSTIGVGGLSGGSWDHGRMMCWEAGVGAQSPIGGGKGGGEHQGGLHPPADVGLSTG